MKKTNENAQAVEVKETAPAPKATAPKATKAPKAESIKLETGATGTGATKAETAEATKPETKAAAAAPSSPEPPTPTPTAATKPVEEKVEEPQPMFPERVAFRLSKSVQIELIPVWGTGLWSVCDGVTSVCLSEYSYSKMMKVIENCNDYKEIIKALNECMKLERFEKHTRHSIERDLIKELGGHTHTHHIRRFFI